MHLAFDLDGVLLDSESDLGWLDRALAAALEDLGLRTDGPVREALFPPTVEDVEAAADAADVAPQRLWEARNARYVEGKLEAMRTGEIGPFDDVEALYGLADRHELHVISDSPERVVDAFVEAFGYDDLFGVAVGRGESLEDLRRLKPNPHPYRRLVRALDGAEPAAYVGDTATDREFAAATGMRFIHLTRDDVGLRSLRELPPRVDP